MLTRKDVASQLSEAARLLEVLGEDEFKARGFHVCARMFEAFDGDVMRLHQEDRFTELRGVGAGTAAELKAMFEHGTMPILERLRERVPSEVRELFAVAGLGAKRIGVLWRNGITGLGGLVAAAEEGRLAALPGFGAKSSARLLEAARFAVAARSRMRLDEARLLAESVVAALASNFPNALTEPAGEYRRGLETIGELELVVAGPSPDELEAFAGALFDERSEDAISGKVAGLRLRLTHSTVRALGAVLALRTGSEAYSQRLRKRSLGMGLDLDDPEVLEALDAPEEGPFIRKLGLEPVVPELRESAEARPVAGLIDLADVRGLVHNHTTWSDGTRSIREMVEAARQRGFAYLALADHSRSSTVANGLTPERVERQAAEVRLVREELVAEGSRFELLHGLEVDILADGTLDMPAELLARLDYVVVSVHQGFNLGLRQQTDRIVRAVNDPNVHILAHATGRLLLRRPGYEVDLQSVIEACAETGTVIEINANPRRLDLDWRWVEKARSLGCKFSIDPDAHDPRGFEDLRYGVTMARKAGLTKNEVVVTAASGREFLSRLGKG